MTLLEQSLADLTSRLRGRDQKTPDGLGAWLGRFPSYNWDWPHMRLLTELLERHARGEIRNLMIFMPPQHGKTSLTTIRYPVYRLERDSGLRVVSAAYNQLHASRFGRAARRIARDDAVLRFSGERDSAVEWEIEGGGSYRSVGVGSGLTGLSADLLVIDDPIKDRLEADSEIYRERLWDWYVEVALSRLQSGGQQLLVQTRWHHDDLAGRILASPATRWEVVNLPAIATGADDPLGRAPGDALCPHLHPLGQLEEARALNPASFESLYQGNPTPREGALFKVGELGIVSRETMPTEMLSSLAWDLGASEDGDYTALAQCWKTDTYWLLDIERWREEPAARNRRIRQAAELRKPSRILIPQDPGAGGKEAAQTLIALLAGFAVEAKTVSGSKEVRAEPLAAQINAGNVRLLDSPYARDFVEELRQFPRGKHDDMVDAAGDAFKALSLGVSQIYAPVYGAVDQPRDAIDLDDAFDDALWPDLNL